MATRRISSSAEDLVSALLAADDDCCVCVLDSCNAAHPSSDRLIAGIEPVERFEISESDPKRVLDALDSVLKANKAAIFTISYDFGNKLMGLDGQRDPSEPDMFVALFDELLFHDYNSGESLLAGTESRLTKLDEFLRSGEAATFSNPARGTREVISNFSRTQYLAAFDAIKERIRAGDTYQTNLTQKLTADVVNERPQDIFWRIRQNSPVPFAAFIQRPGSTVVSASPERFFRVSNGLIEASPIKGTRPRGRTQEEDGRLLRALVTSSKDRAENTMIVDLLRNDLGRVCDYGSVEVRALCEPLMLPAVFHLYSTIDGRLPADAKPSDIVSALFPCGSITGAPKLSTMRIIDELEPDARGLSMGAIGVYIPDGYGVPPALDLSVAIRTMVIRGGVATFNVGGGITIDSDFETEYEESWAKAAPLLQALGCLRPKSTIRSTDAEHSTGFVV